MRSQLLLAAAALVACAEPDRVVAPIAKPQFAISDGKSGGTKGFYFLPPLVPPPQATGSFDAALEPEVAVCTLTATTCGPEVAHFTMSSNPAVTLDFKGGAYALNWQTKGSLLAAGNT